MCTFYFNKYCLIAKYKKIYNKTDVELIQKGDLLLLLSLLFR